MPTLPNTQIGADDAIACTLTPDRYRDRADGLAQLARRALRSRAPLADGERLTFDGDAGTERALRAAVAAEASCCSFLTMHLEHQDDALVLDVTGPARARPIIAHLFQR